MADLVITCLDAPLHGSAGEELRLTLPNARVTAQELIEQRVGVEFTRPKATRRWIAQAPDRDLALDEAVAHALAAFERGHFLLIVGDRQAERLADAFVMLPDTRVKFIRLMPLIGG